MGHLVPHQEAIGGLSYASNTQMFWQISIRRPETVDYRSKWRNDTEKRKEIRV